MINEDLTKQIIEKHQLSTKMVGKPRVIVQNVSAELKEKGLSNAEIAEELTVSEATVRVLLHTHKLDNQDPEN